MYTFFERIGDENTSDKKPRSSVRSDVSATSNHRSLPVVYSIDDSRSDADNSCVSDNHEIQVRSENIILVYLDLYGLLTRDLICPLRIIHDDIQIFSNLEICLNLLRYSNDRIFFISSLNDEELIKDVHNCSSVEAIFLLNSDVLINKSRFPKLVGVYIYSEELFTALKNTLKWSEQTQIEFFAFEYDQIFLWLQLWKEEFINSTISSDKEKLVNMAEKYYRGNTKLLESLDNFDYCYEKNDALQWCFASPFPSRFLRHTLSTRNTEYLDLCRFLITDISDVLQQQPTDLKANHQFFKGMKLTREDLRRLMKNTGKMICAKGFFTCTRCKKAALDLARSPDYRPDLRPVLFKINCDPSVPFGELPMKSAPGLIVFDVYTAFRVKYVNRDLVSVVKIEVANEDGRRLTREYRMKCGSENVQSLLGQLSALPKPSTQLPPIERPSPSTSEVLSDEELQAQRLAQHGKVDEALSLYKNLRTRSTRVLNTMGQLYADQKGDYKSAIKHYKKALKLQEKNDEDTTQTLTQLGIAHHNRREFDLALAYHNRALNLQKNNNQADQKSVASSLIGIANAQCGQDNLSEALNNVQQALTLNESIESGNDLNLAMNLAVFANIHHTSGNDIQALEYTQRALTILKRCVLSDSLTLASVLNNMGAIQLGLGLFSDARDSFDQALKICGKTLPQGHPKRVTMEINIQRIEEIIKNSQLQS